MCNRALNWAYEQELPVVEKFVLVTIANMINGKTNLCWPSQETIAKRCSICRQRVNRALATLRRMGLVLIEKRVRSRTYALPPLPAAYVAHDDTSLDMSPTTTHDMSPTTTHQPPHVAHGDTEPLEERKKDSVANATGADAPADPLKAMWDRGRALLGKSAGGLIGRALRDHGDDAVIAAICACEREGGGVEPIQYFMGCLRRYSNKRTAMDKFYAGAMEAADELTRQQQANGGAYYTPFGSLLDGR